MKLIRLKVDLDVELPTLPNFLKTKEGITVATKDLSRKELQLIGEHWTAALMDKGY